jgi:hypothetical protein
MLDRTRSSISSEKHFTEIKLDPGEAQELLDQYFKPGAIFAARICSKFYPRSRLEARQIAKLRRE